MADAARVQQAQVIDPRKLLEFRDAGNGRYQVDRASDRYIKTALEAIYKPSNPQLTDRDLTANVNGLISKAEQLNQILARSRVTELKYDRNIDEKVRRTGTHILEQSPYDVMYQRDQAHYYGLPVFTQAQNSKVDLGTIRMIQFKDRKDNKDKAVDAIFFTATVNNKQADFIIPIDNKVLIETEPGKILLIDGAKLVQERGERPQLPPPVNPGKS